MAINSNNQLLEDKNYILPFGQYKDMSVQDIMDINPQYLMWAHDDEKYVPWFELTGWLYDEVAELI